jgi:hypothetical protein
MVLQSVMRRHSLVAAHVLYIRANLIGIFRTSAFSRRSSFALSYRNIANQKSSAVFVSQGFRETLFTDVEFNLSPDGELT